MIKLVDAYDYKKEIKALFTEYTNMLIEGDESFKAYLEIQNYDHELENLEEKYGRPWGRLYIVFYKDSLAGCIGLRKIDDTTCEMKRLYVKPEFRKKGIGEHLVKKIIIDAGETGYSKMRLDTLPFLEAATKIYKKYGFREIPCYNNSPMDNSIYMQLDL